MKVNAGRNYAVITGDIVDSSSLRPAERKILLREMRRAGSAAQKAFPKAVPLPVGIFRGDGWQMLIAQPVVSVRVALFYRAFLIAQSPGTTRLDTRMAIAVGEVTFVPAKKVSQGDGEAYRASGQGLESLRRKEGMRVIFPGGKTPPAVDAIVALIDSHAQSWTGRQARAVMGALQEWPQEKIARLWPERIAQPTVGAHLDKAGWPAVGAGLAWVEHELAGIMGLEKI
jgi:hypothetical protein